MKLAAALVAILLVNVVKSECEVHVEENLPNRTICRVEKLKENKPLQPESRKTPDFLYINVGRGQIPEDTFTQLKAKKELWFLGENITYIQPGAFAHLNQLQNLAITMTLIRNISRDSFQGLGDLKILSLIKNKIEHIEDGAFNNLGKVEQLLLNENNLRRINETTFRGLEALFVLELDDNPIEYIHPEAFRNMRNLTQVKISLVNRSVDQRALEFLDPNRKIIHYL